MIFYRRRATAALRFFTAAPRVAVGAGSGYCSCTICFPAALTYLTRANWVQRAVPMTVKDMYRLVDAAQTFSMRDRPDLLLSLQFFEHMHSVYTRYSSGTFLLEVVASGGV